MRGPCISISETGRRLGGENEDIAAFDEWEKGKRSYEREMMCREEIDKVEYQSRVYSMDMSALGLRSKKQKH